MEVVLVSGELDVSVSVMTVVVIVILNVQFVVVASPTKRTVFFVFR